MMGFRAGAVRRAGGGIRCSPWQAATPNASCSRHLQREEHPAWRSNAASAASLGYVPEQERTTPGARSGRRTRGACETHKAVTSAVTSVFESAAHERHMPVASCQGSPVARFT